MTREEFIGAYMASSGIADYSVDGEEVRFDGGTMLALPCACDDEDCRGWVMASPDDRKWHMEAYARATAPN
jgi:hypothetical protein